MSSVDDRIVRMQFDNGQFNKGVESTTKALSGLESSLKLDGMANNIDSIGCYRGNSYQSFIYGSHQHRCEDGFVFG